MQVLISLFLLALFIGGLIVKFVRDQASNLSVNIEETLDATGVLDRVVIDMAEMMKEKDTEAQTEAEHNIMIQRRNEMEQAMSQCVYGIDKHKIRVKEMIQSSLYKILPDIEACERVYHLNSTSINRWYKFEILMERLYSEHKEDALPYLIDKYGWALTKYNIEDGTVPSYNVTPADLDEAFNGEITERLSYLEEINIISTINYAQYKGMGVIDTLRTMNIDGFNIGTSGAIMSTGKKAQYKANASVWVYYHGNYIHFQFLEFKDEFEVRRVVQLLARYNNPGPLTEKRGYVITTMYDKSRVLALRPPASEYWACFVRKFVLSSNTLEALINPPAKDEKTGKILHNPDGSIKPLYENAFLPKYTIMMLMRGQVTTVFTGRQGSGKTTMMTAAISQVDGRFNIRVLETAPEMYLREIYQRRNILSVAETPTVNASQLQDALKKSDAALSIVGEVATDIIAARMIQMGQVASIFTICSHHANRTKDLIHALTNSVVAASGGSATPATVEPQVIDVVKMDAHLDYDVRGHRYIERITEVIRLDSRPYPEQEPGESDSHYKIRLDKEYYTRRTDRETFTTQDILRFDTARFRYDVARDEKGYPIFCSEELTKHILSRIPRDDLPRWQKFIKDYWYDDILAEPTLPYKIEEAKKAARLARGGAA